MERLRSVKIIQYNNGVRLKAAVMIEAFAAEVGTSIGERNNFGSGLTKPLVVCCSDRQLLTRTASHPSAPEGMFLILLLPLMPGCIRVWHQQSPRRWNKV